MVKRLKHHLRLWGLTPEKLWGKYGPHPAPKILANSLPKSGTHLLERFLSLVPGVSRQFDRKLCDDGKGLRGLQRQCSRLRKGQFLLAHLFYNDEYLKVLDQFGIKSMLMIRDPRDIVVSSYQYMTYGYKKHNMHDYFANHLKTDKERLHVCIRGNTNPEEYSIGYLLEKFYPWTQNEKVLTIRFRDLIGVKGGGSHETQKRTADEILNFIGVDLSNAQREELMKKVFFTGSKTFHKGRISQWKEEFDEQDKALFKEFAGEWLIKLGFEKDYNW